MSIWTDAGLPVPANYYVNRNAQQNGDHEVHREGCEWLALALDTALLGSYTNCRDAVMHAKRLGYRANGCKTCSRDCHTG